MKIYHESGINKGRIIDPDIAHEMALVEDKIRSKIFPLRKSKKSINANEAAEQKGAELKQIKGLERKITMQKRTKAWEAIYGKNLDINEMTKEQAASLVKTVIDKSYYGIEILQEDIDFINNEVTKRTPEEFEQLNKNRFIYPNTPTLLTSVQVGEKTMDIYMNTGVFPNQKNRKGFNLFVQESEQKGVAKWNRSEIVAVRVDNKGALGSPDKNAPNGYFIENGEYIPIIGRDTNINRGVYLGGSEREAIVIDDTKDAVLILSYQEIFKKLADFIKIKGSVSTAELLQTIFDFVKKAMPYNETKVDELTAKFSGDKKIPLGEYILNRAGVCRHQALLTGYVIEKLIKDKHSEGHVSVDRNALAYMGAHAWVRYISQKGQIYIIDPAQNYCGKIEDVKNKKNAWSYKRPGE